MNPIPPRWLKRLLQVCVCATVALFAAAPSPAQDGRTTVLDVTVAVQAAAPHVVITWQWPEGGHNNVLLMRREKGQTLPADWQNLGIGNVATSYEDFDALPGKTYDYHLSCIPTGQFRIGTRFTAGYQLPLVESRGKVILLVDQTMAAPLAVELAQWERDAVADGYQVIRRDVPRETVPASSTATSDYPKRIAEQSAIRALVKAEYDLDPASDWYLFIVGHVPVPFSGSSAYDGHADHVGAWPTDTYYADVNGTWTDSTVNVKAASAGTRNWNVPGDGKFDQVKPPSALELATGRVDLIHMDGVTVGMSETELLRQYFVRNHRFRIHAAPYRTVPRAGFVRDNFQGHGVGAWMNSFSMFGTLPGQSDHMDWFDEQGRARLFGHGSGGGSYLSADGVGTTADFIRKDSKVVFSTMFGSYFGDWGWESRVFLKGPLAGTANSLGLATSWTPDYLLNHTALGDTIGQGMKLTQSVVDGVWTGYAGLSRNLLGDPTLRLHSIIRPENLVAVSSAPGVNLTWSASPDFNIAGYHIYRSANSDGPFLRISGGATSTADPLGSPVQGTTFTDTAAVSGATYFYQVKAVRMETSASGTYANQSLGTDTSITHQSAVPVPARPGELQVGGTPGGGYVLTWTDNASNETGYRVERRNPVGGAWAETAVLAPGVTTWTDPAPPEGRVYYRVRASGAGGFSEFSEPAADHEMTGVVLMPGSVMVNKTAGQASVAVERFNGSRRDAVVSYSTSALIGGAGVDHTPVSGELSWGHLESGIKQVSIPVTNLAGGQLTKIFLLNTTPDIPMVRASFENTAVFVGDTATKHNWQNSLVGTPWWYTALGAFDWSTKDGLDASSVWAQQGYGEHVGGTFGIAARTGNIRVGATTDSLAMIRRSVTGDFQFTARVTEMTTEITPGMQVGLTVRSNATGANAIMRSLFLTSKSTLARASRSAVGGTVGYADDTGAVVPFPCWMRAIRTGNQIAYYYSADGVNWTASGTPSTLSIGTTPTVGMMMNSSPSIITGRMGYARFDNVSLHTVPLPPASPVATAGSVSGRILVSWEVSAAATEYSVERSVSAGSGFTEIARVPAGTLTYTDNSLPAGVTYYYRIKALNPAYQSGYTSVVSVAPFLASGIAGWRYTVFGTEAAAGDAADDADPDQDGLNNLVEYALGRSPLVAHEEGQELEPKVIDVNGETYLSYTFTESTTATGVTIMVQAAGSPAGPWQDIDPALAINRVSLLENTPRAGVRTLTVKDVEPVGASGKRFMRLKITQQ